MRIGNSARSMLPWPEERGLQAAETSSVPARQGQVSHLVSVARFCSLKAALLLALIHGREPHGGCKASLANAVPENEEAFIGEVSS